MKHLFLIFTLVYNCYCVKEDLPDLQTLLNDPDALFMLEKRIGSLLEELGNDADAASPPPVECSALLGVLDNDCEFHAKNSTIIKTTESLARNSSFLEDISNVSCARDCTAFCCEHKDCDTSVYQDKDEHNCYLFRCGSPSRCVFADHGDYWMSSVSKDVHSTHSLVPGGATVTHENELQNLGSDSHNPKPHTTESPTTRKPRAKPGLNQSCGSYSVQCNDSHAECLMGVCKCRVGYHEKNGMCRQHCREEEFECKKLVPGVVSRQCVHKSYMCDGNQDCTDGSDEYNCVDQDKPAYLDSDLMGNVYNNPLYNLPYGSQSDSQYPYGFPIPGLTNQQQTGPFSNNQLYPGQLQSPGNTGGGYYIPAQGQQVNVPQTGNQRSGQWPFIDKSVNIGSPIYPNNLPYQTAQQPGFIPQQQKTQTGYVPGAQQPVQQVNTKVQPVQPASQTRTGSIQQKSANAGQIQVKPQVYPAVQHQVTQRPINLRPQPKPQAESEGQNQDFLPKNAQAETVEQQKAIKTSDNRPRYPEDDFEDSYSRDKTKSTHRTDDSDSDSHTNQNSDVEDLPKSKSFGRFDVDDDDDEYQQHLSEVDHFENKPQPAAAVKPQTPDKTPPVAEHKSDKSNSNSEGYIDYSWIGYDSNSPRINGKKGPSHKNDDKEPQKTTKKPTPSVGQTKAVNIKQETRKPVSVDTDGPRDRTNDDRNGYQSNRYQDRYRTRYNDFDRTGNNRRPSYDRYPDQYGSNNNRHRPSHGSRYPFYESNYGRGRDRNPYPVWDSMKAEYYYPDDYEDKNFGSVPGMGGMGTGQQGMDYPYMQTDDRVSGTRPHNTKPKVAHDDSVLDVDRPVVTEAPKKPVPATQAPAAPPKQAPLTTPKPLPMNPEQPVQSPDTEASSEESQISDSTGDAESSNNSESTETQSADKDSKESNATKSETGAEGSGEFKFLNVESVEVDSYSDNSQGPIVALSLGLAITVMLLIFVGCRLRTVKRRLRKGRALHSNEADYLINGMYL